MKKSILLIYSLLLFSFSLFGEYKRFDFSIEPFFGIMNGKIEESVTYFDDDKVRTYESRLDWDVKNLKTYGAEFSFNLFRFVNLNFTTIKGIPGVSGNMQDYDWLNPLTYSWINDDPSELTNYSCHNNTFENYSKIKFDLGANIFIPGKIKLIPHAGMTNEYLKMTAIGGYYIYKDFNFKRYDFNEDQKVISYEQSLQAFLFGLTADIKSIPRTFIQLDFSISPDTVHIEAVDTHIARNIKFNDKMYHARNIEGTAKAFYLITEHFGIGAKGFIQYIPNTFGADWMKTGYSLYKASEEGGSNRLLWSIQISGLCQL